MKRSFIIAVFALALTLVVYGQIANNRTSQSSKVAQQLIRLKHEIGRAYVNKDVAALERLYADDYTVTDAQGHTTGKADEIARLRSGDAVYEATSYEDVKVRVYGDVAIVAGRGTVKGKRAGQAFHTQYHSTNVFVKQGVQWRAVAAHISGVKSL